MLDPGRIRALLFDMDGTLADTDDAYIAAVAKMIRPLNFIFPRRDPTRFLRWGLMKTEAPFNWLMTIPDQLGLDDQFAAFTDWLHRLRGHGTPGEFWIVEGTRAMLEALSAQYPLALVTSRGQRNVDAFLDQFELRPYFKAIVSALAAEHIKPHPAPVRKAAELLGVPVEHCLMTGDTTLDIQAGRRAGAQTAGVLCGFGERYELERAGADLILETTADLATKLLP
jgi:phosphoglycolate phosphatase